MTFVLWKKFVSHTKHTNQPSLIAMSFFFNVHLLLFEFVEIIITQMKRIKQMALPCSFAGLCHRYCNARGGRLRCRGCGRPDQGGSLYFGPGTLQADIGVSDHGQGCQGLGPG